MKRLSKLTPIRPSRPGPRVFLDRIRDVDAELADELDELLHKYAAGDRETIKRYPTVTCIYATLADEVRRLTGVELSSYAMRQYIRRIRHGQGST